MLAPGTRLGVYEVVAPIGAGGMGEVYRARDTKLGRDVAIKVLPATLTNDPERLARFSREAQALASLNHPNIAAIHHVEDTDGGPALVMELVEGETLADRLERGPIPVDEALAIAKQIADAVEAAHDRGIIHRDLKPANIKLRSDGAVKVLDFGLAKLIEQGHSASELGVAAAISLSPTITSTAMTGVGVLLGTAAYMSPEQANGQHADRQSDIWAFGCVLYELLTRRPAFPGDTVSAVIARVLEREPDYAALPASTPTSVRRVIARCLAKDRRHRLRHIGDVIADLEDARRPEKPLPSTRKRPALLTAVPFVLAALVGALAAGFGMWETSPSGAARVQYLAVGADASERPWLAQTGSIAISPDGSEVAYLSVINGFRHLRLWSVDRGVAITLASDGLPGGPFFSPDGKWVAFYDEADSAIKRVAVQGGTAQTICRFTTSLRGATWMSDGTIVFGTSLPGAGLYRVVATGGQPIAVTTAGQLQNHRWPSALPGKRTILFTMYDRGQAQLAALDLDTGMQHPLPPQGSHARYTPTGHLVYASGANLWAVAFDLNGMVTKGDPVVVINNIQSSGIGLAEFDVSTNGSLVYLPAANIRRALGWVDTNGHMVEELVDGDIRYPRLSPDGTKVAFTAVGRTQNATDIWIRDLARGTEVRVTFDGQNQWPAWAPDGSAIAFGSNRATPQSIDLYSARVGFPGEPTRLADVDIGAPGSWTRDGTALVYTQLSSGRADSGSDVWIAPRSGAAPRSWLTTRFSEEAPRLSPDGRWLAYVSDQTGDPRVYVQPFPEGGRVIPVSTGRGSEPVWSADGTAVFYRDANRLMIAGIRNGEVIAPPRVIFTAPFEFDVNAVGMQNYDVSPDGRRFLMIAATDDARPTGRFVQNWFEELKRLAATK